MKAPNRLLYCRLIDADLMQRSFVLRHIPLSLTLLRLLLGPGIVVLAFVHAPGWVLGVAVIVGILSDIFDGILARRLGVATAALRRLDSTVDVVFFVGVLGAIAVARPAILGDWKWGIGLLLGLEALAQVVSLAKFRRPAGTHARSAKGWGLLLCASCTAILAWGWTGWLLSATIVVGALAYLESISIILILPHSAIDVPSLFHAFRRRREQLASAPE